MSISRQIRLRRLYANVLHRYEFNRHEKWIQPIKWLYCECATHANRSHEKSKIKLNITT